TWTPAFRSQRSASASSPPMPTLAHFLWRKPSIPAPMSSSPGDPPIQRSHWRRWYTNSAGKQMTGTSLRRDRLRAISSNGARAADRIVRERLAALGLAFEEIHTEFFGVNACHGAAAPPNADPPEVQVRIGVRGQERRAVDRFTRELIPLVLNGPPGATGFGDGRPLVREIVAYWSALVPREEIRTSVEVLG